MGSTGALLLTGALIFLAGMLAGACVVRVRVTKWGERMLIEIGSEQKPPGMDPFTGSPLPSRVVRWWRAWANR